jgi:hypothetical protein
VSDKPVTTENKLYTLDQLVTWLESFQPVLSGRGEDKDGWRFALPGRGMPEQLIMILQDYTGAYPRRSLCPIRS